MNQQINAEGPVAQVLGHGWADVCQEHIDALVESLRPFIRVGAGSTLTLHGYKPPYDAGPTPDGLLEFTVSAPGQADVAFALEFGGDPVERYGFDDLSLGRLEDVARDGDPINLRASVANFDEMWKFACQFAEKVGIANIQMRYGV